MFANFATVKKKPHLYFPFCYLGIKSKNFFSYIKRPISPWLVWLSGLSASPRTKDWRFDSQSGHMPGLQARSPVGVCERQPHTDVSLPLFLLPFPSKNK